MRFRTSFPYETAHEDVRVPMPDSTRLYARIWRPLTDEPVPALLEYEPHRLTDATAPRDRQRHPWYAGHGYASVRVDVRGHGNSEGVPGTAHHATGRAGATELADGVEVVNWLAARPWCTGRVGMIGIGWGGSTALRVAALAPGPLGAVVTVCAPDSRYDEDAPRPGGAVLTAGLHSAPADLLAFAARPPDPAHVGDLWREMWLARLEALEPPLPTWPDHRARDEHGRGAGSQAAIEAPVLAVGGWHDPYRDAVLRLVEHLPRDRVRGIIGPWSHQYPDRGLPPGPAIGFLQETLRWWDHHLKGRDTGVMREPLLRSWLPASHPPATTYPELPGRWVADDAWPSPNVTPVTYALQGPHVLVRSPQHTGLDAGRFVPSGNDADLPPDQRAEDAHSACFDFPVPPGGGPIEILGRPRVRLALRGHAPTGQVIARLCDVAPGGASTLVTRGALALRAEGPPDGEENGGEENGEHVFDLHPIAHTFPPGHRVRLAVSSAYWPWIWPAPDAAGFTLDPASCSLELPLRAPTTDTVTFQEPEQSLPLGINHPATLDEAQRPALLLVRDVARGVWRLEADPQYGGVRIHPDGLEHGEDAVETYTITEDDPLSARARTAWTIRFHRPDLPWNASVDTRSEITCDPDHFIASSEVICKEGAEVVFHRTWEKRVPRT
ncbi:CocE/NonD family hydrolase [Streptomyces sp. NPDC006368]|uniref:CocE/NonD family hydrolase n=1 Tax=Streptomyces sp. NPDC006368 TaxID=3156760 RepID=UPI0033B899F8